MLDESLAWMPTLVVVAVVAAVSIHRARTFRSTLVTLLAITYAGGLAATTLFPIPIDALALADMRELGGSHANLVPFGTIQGAWVLGPERVLRQLVGNVLLFVPLGLLAPLLGGRESFGWKRVMLLGLAISLVIEGTQLCVSGLLRYGYRSPDIDDVVLNFIGTVLGLLIFDAGRSLYHTVRRDRA